MVKQKRKAVCTAVLTAILLLLCLAACGSETPPESGLVETPSVTENAQPGGMETPITDAAEDFSCYALDQNGQKIYGYASEEAGVWYLFVPGTVDVSALKIYVSDNVETVSSGTLDAADWTVSGAFAENNVLTLTCDSGTARVKVMQSNLPSLHIVLTDTTLEEVHKDKDLKYKKNSIYLTDPAGEYDLVVEGSVELKGRGNSTWAFFEKKGYQIKFDEKTSVFGMGKAKKWVLLANACDDSLMRSMLVYQTAAQMDMAFVPSFEYIDLWVNGEYRGTYILGEKVELGGSRLDLEDPKGALFEHDEGFYHEEDYWFLSDYLQRHFAMKEFVSEDDEATAQAAMAEFAAAVDELAAYLYSTPSEEVTLAELSTMIDVDSFIKYYLINEFALNHEGFVSSFYWYKDGSDDVIHLGPIWDFDTCMGNEGSDYNMTSGDKHILFRYLLAIPEFCDRTVQLMESYWSLFAEMDSNAKTIFREIEQSAEMNYLRWDVLGKANAKAGGTDFGDTYEEAVNTLVQWLQGREAGFRILKPTAVTSVVSADSSRMDLRYSAGQDLGEVQFAVWSRVNGTDDLMWYAGQMKDGVWTASADLTQHDGFGLYEIQVYRGGLPVAAGNNYVERYGAWIETSVSEDGSILNLMLEDTSAQHTQIRFAMWSEEEGRDNLHWYNAQCGLNGVWSSTVDLTALHTEGLYHIYAYGVEENRPLTTALVYVGAPKIIAECSADQSMLDITMEYVLDDTLRVWMAVWSEQDGQDDLIWYEMEKQGDTTWFGNAAITDTGTYLIHIYSGESTPATLLDGVRANVP